MHKVPRIHITVSGKDFVHYGRIKSISLNDFFGTEAEADQLVLKIHAPGAAMPKRGVELVYSVGWKDEAINQKGVFVVDEAALAGPPDVFTINARSADFRQSLKQQREKSYKDVTIGDVLQFIAAQHGLPTAISPKLAAIPVKQLDQQESDAHLITRIAVDYAHRASIKSGVLVVMPRNAVTTAGGTPLQNIAMDYANIQSYSYHEDDQERYTGVRAFFYEKGKDEKKAVIAGSKGYQYTLQNQYANKTTAEFAAEARWQDIKSTSGELEVRAKIPLLQAQAGMLATLMGFNPIVPSQGWRIEKITLDYTKGAGFSQRMQLRR